jgi:hypothetical protein
MSLQVLLAELVSGDIAEYTTPTGRGMPPGLTGFITPCHPKSLVVTAMTGHAPIGISSYDYFARSCARQGTTIACGAYQFNKGAVFIYTIDPKTGKTTLQQTLLPPARAISYAWFGTLVMACHDFDWMTILRAPALTLALPQAIRSAWMASTC